MAQNTAIQELINEINDSIKGINKHGDKHSEFNQGAISNLSTIKSIARSLLPKERQDMIDVAEKAFDAGDDYGWGKSEFEGESVTPTKKQYLNQTFPQNKDMAEIFYNGKIYVGALSKHEYENVFNEGSDKLWVDYLNEIPDIRKYPVTGTHSFKDGQDVTGLYELGNDKIEGTNKYHVVAIPITTPPDKLDKEAATNIPDGENDWVIGSETFTRQEVFKLLYTQRAMITNDIKRECNLDKEPLLLNILNNPRSPKF